MVNQASHTKIDWKGLAWQYLFFWYFSGVVHLIIFATGTAGFLGIRAAIYMSTLWLIPTLLFPQQTRRIAAVIGLILLPFALTSLGYLYIYHQEFSQSVLFIIFESNFAESSEYVASYFSWGLLACLLIYTTGAFLIWQRIRPVILPKRGMNMLFILIGLLLVTPFAKNMLIKDHSFGGTVDRIAQNMEPAAPWQIIVGYVEYRKQLQNMQSLLTRASHVAPLKDLKNGTNQASTLVLVIGESTNRQRMSLYGYPRDTTPKLDSIKDQLYTFTNVISPRPYTIETLQQVLTFADQEQPNRYMDTPTIMNMMKQAGYKTFWITNQQTMTARNTMLTAFSKQTDQQFYLNNNRSQNAKQYDDVVFEPFRQVLKDSSDKKFIVVHLLGTHMKYEYRYSEDYAKFTDREQVPAWVKNGEELEAYNSYDNAVLFNDYVVSTLIDLTNKQSQNKNSLLLYLSDHGEEVYDEQQANFKGRNEAAPTAAMYTVPFIMWASPVWKAQHDSVARASLDRPLISSSLIHTWAELANLHFEEWDQSKSIINPAFKPRQRLIGDPYNKKSLRDFDQLIKANASAIH
ncbi:MAG TPA: phosphoethanolamine transferase CptA [Methylotenera sp.]|nr:phosphoethanolamine transferase CptA [Methylotenera sp.]